MAATHDDPPSVAQLVAALPEVYQPIFGHPDLAAAPSRVSTDRLAAIQAVHDALAAHLGRPVKVLDLGCAQGFFCFNLAQRGAAVTGIDFLEPNIALCERLAADNPALAVRFRRAGVESVVPALESGEYDLVLGLSVFHHLVHERGVAAVAAMMGQLAERVQGGIFEMALHEEPVHWAVSQPEDERELLGPFAFVHQLGRFPTHLSSISRPLMYASSKAWYLDGRMHTIETWSEQSHPLVEQVHQGTRRYYFGDGLVAKHFLLAGRLAASNRADIEAEAQVLARPPAALRKAPALRSWGTDGEQAWLVREALPGRLLVELMREGVPYDADRIIRAVLEQLAALEAAGLFHADLRTWNVLVGDDGEPLLIDYGAIASARQDCTWPHDLLLSFTIFIHEVATGRVDRIFPQRKPYLSPLNLPAPYRSWIASLWQHPPAQWSFGLLAGLARQPQHLAEAEVATAIDSWMSAVERHLDTVGAHAAHVEGTVRTLEHQVRTAVEPRLDRLAADMRHWRSQLDALRSVSQQCSDRLVQLSDYAGAEASLWRETGRQRDEATGNLQREMVLHGGEVAALRAAHEGLVAECGRITDTEVRLQDDVKTAVVRLDRLHELIEDQQRAWSEQSQQQMSRMTELQAQVARFGQLAEVGGQNMQQAVELFSGLSATALRSVTSLEESLCRVREDLAGLGAEIGKIRGDQLAQDLREQQSRAASQDHLARIAALEAEAAASRDHLQRIFRSRSWRAAMLLQRLLRLLRLR